MQSADAAELAEPPAPPAPMILNRVLLGNFKAYSGEVSAGPLHERMTTVIGPNGSGKSCLVEGICFALAVSSQQLRAPALAGLVNHAATEGCASVAVAFIEKGGGTQQLVVQRRIVGGSRSEWKLQECDCGPGAAAVAPWVCVRCAVRTVKRDALREALKTRVKIDIDAPERFVVHQSSALCVAQKAPAELLAFFEGVLGTDGLRARMQQEATLSLELSATLREAHVRLEEERHQMSRHGMSILAFRRLEQSRAKLEQAKKAHLRRELTFYSRYTYSHASDLSHATLRPPNTLLPSATTLHPLTVSIIPPAFYPH